MSLELTDNQKNLMINPEYYKEQIQKNIDKLIKKKEELKNNTNPDKSKPYELIVDIRHINNMKIHLNLCYDDAIHFIEFIIKMLESAILLLEYKISEIMCTPNEFLLNFNIMEERTLNATEEYVDIDLVISEKYHVIRNVISYNIVNDTFSFAVILDNYMQLISIDFGLIDILMTY